MASAKVKKSAPRAAKKAAAKRKGKLAPRGKSRGMEAAEVSIALDDPQIAAVAELTRSTGGAPIGAYRGPLGGRALLLAKRHHGATEAQFTAEFESADLLTLGVVYEQSSRFAGGAYSSLLKEGDTQPPMPIAQALTRMAAAAKNFKLEPVSNSDLAWVAVGAGAPD